MAVINSYEIPQVRNPSSTPTLKSLNKISIPEDVLLFLLQTAPSRHTLEGSKRDD